MPQTGTLSNETIIGHLPMRERCHVLAHFSQGGCFSVAGSCLPRTISLSNRLASCEKILTVITIHLCKNIKFCGLWQPRKITTKISRYNIMYNSCLYLPPIWIVYSSLTMYVDDFVAFLAHTIHKRPSHLSTWGFPSTASLTQSVSSLHISGDLLEHFGLSDYLPTQLHAAAIYGELALTV